MKASLLLLLLPALAMAGCVEAGGGPPEAPAAAPPDEPAQPRQVPIEGTLTFGQALSVVCPVYVLSPTNNATSYPVEVDGALAVDVRFEWTPAEPAFEGATFALHHDAADLGGNGTGVSYGPQEWPRASGASPFDWHIDAAELTGFGHGGYLAIEGPACLPDEEAARTGVRYEQAIRFTGNVTFPA